MGLPWSGWLTDKGCLCSAVSEASCSGLYSTTLQNLVAIPTNLHCVPHYTTPVQFIRAKFIWLAATIWLEPVKIKDAMRTVMSFIIKDKFDLGCKIMWNPYFHKIMCLLWHILRIYLVVCLHWNYINVLLSSLLSFIERTLTEPSQSISNCKVFLRILWCR